MKRSYEITFIVRVDAGDDTYINGVVDQVRGWVEANELGQVTTINRWGRRKLAYEINRQREGFYVLIDADLEPKAIDEIERNMNISQDLLRYLIVRKDA